MRAGISWCLILLLLALWQSFRAYQQFSGTVLRVAEASEDACRQPLIDFRPKNCQSALEGIAVLRGVELIAVTGPDDQYFAMHHTTPASRLEEMSSQKADTLQMSVTGASLRRTLRLGDSRLGTLWLQISAEYWLADIWVELLCLLLLAVIGLGLLYGRLARHRQAGEDAQECKELKKLSQHQSKLEQRCFELQKRLHNEMQDHEISRNGLQESSESLKSLINAMPFLLIVVDAAQRILWINDEAVLRLHLDFDNLEGELLCEVVPGFPEWSRLIYRAFESGEPVYDEGVKSTLEGGEAILNLAVFPMSKHPASTAMLKIEDVTEAMRLQEVMVQTEKMISIGGLTAGMAHEINNPLAGILQSSQVLKKRLFQDLKANHIAASESGVEWEALQKYLKIRGIDEFLASIEQGGSRASGIVKSMLAFSRKSNRCRSEVDLKFLLQETLSLSGIRDSEVEIRLEEDLPPLCCERTQLQQVLLNMLKNAAQAMQEAATPKPRIRLIARVLSSWMEILVEDNGPGIAPENLRRVFEPFYTTKDPGRGTGLGLSVSYFIVCEVHRGELSVESVPAQYTRFRIRLPL